MEVLENVYKDSKSPINLAITYLENEELEVNLESFSNEQKCELNALFIKLKAEDNIDNRSDIADTLLELLELDLIRTISQDTNQPTNQSKTREDDNLNVA
ncbi:unnamed protein product [Diamesa serratosioi]